MSEVREASAGTGAQGREGGGGRALETLGAPRHATDREAEQRFSRAQRTTILSGIVSLVALIVVLQLWLLTATMNAHLGGELGVAAPAAAASLVCFLLVLGLLRYVYRLER